MIKSVIIQLLLAPLALLAARQGMAAQSQPENHTYPEHNHYPAESLVEKGERIFFNETFKGNGRTCGTCHPAENNFTIDPKFIAKLPPHDPLFVAEFIPALAELEVPVLLRKFGLIRENLDGFDQPAVLRGVPHVLSLRTTITIDPTTAANFGLSNATGWSTDGAPGDGSLRNFAFGAVVQHLTKTLNRVPGTDFRLPTSTELDALEAFMLSLGRQEFPPDLSTITFRDEVVERGKVLFNDPDAGGKCVRCHFGGGANNAANQFNVTANTGVELLPDQPARLVAQAQGLLVPVDGGLGPPPLVCSDTGGFGDCRFNSTPLIEAADTPPFFHNNSINTIEVAVAFFNSDAFNQVTGIPGGIKLEPTEVVAIAAMLRTLNALENIRNSNQLESEIPQFSFYEQYKNERLMRKLATARADTEDAIEVLEGAQFLLYDNAIELLKRALYLEDEALRAMAGPKQKKLLQQAITLKTQARGLMVVE